MKPKAFNKRLGLKKETIVNLNDREMGALYGGDYSGEPETCDSCICVFTVGDPMCHTHYGLSCGPLSECNCNTDPTKLGC